MNEFFSSIGSKLAQNVDREWKYDGDINLNVINECRTTVSEVIKYAKQIHIHKSSAIRHVNSMVIRDLFLTVPDVIVKLFNVALDQGFSTFFHRRTPGVYMIHDTYPQAEKNILFANMTQHCHYI